MVLVVLSVDTDELALFKSQRENLGVLLGGMLQVCTLGQSLCAVQDFSSADAGSPDAHVVGILQLGEVGMEPVLVQIVNLFLSAQVAVASESDDFHTWSHYQEGHIEPYLVISCTRAAVCYGAGAYLLGISGYGQRLEDAFRTHADGIAVVAEHIAIHHILERLLVILLCDIQCDVLGSTQFVCILLVGLQLLRAESSCVGACCVYLIPLFLGQIHHGVTGVEAAAEGNHHFLLLFHICLYACFSLFDCLFYTSQDQGSHDILEYLQGCGLAMMLVRIPEHPCTDAEASLLLLQYVVIAASQTASPEGFVVRQLIETHGYVSQCRIHLHHSITAGEAEYLGMWPSYACQCECVVLDTFCHTSSLIIGVHYEAAGGDIMLVSPGFYITESCKLVSVECQYGFCFFHLSGHVLMSTFGNACPALLSGFLYGGQYGVHVYLVCCLCHHYPYVVFLCHHSCPCGP